MFILTRIYLDIYKQDLPEIKTVTHIFNSYEEAYKLAIDTVTKYFINDIPTKIIRSKKYKDMIKNSKNIIIDIEDKCITEDEDFIGDRIEIQFDNLKTIKTNEWRDYYKECMCVIDEK